MTTRHPPWVRNWLALTIALSSCWARCRATTSRYHPSHPKREGTMAEPTTYCGWHRTGSRRPWRKLCQGATQGECWRLLFDLVRGGDTYVGHASIDPNKPAERKRDG